MTMQGRVEAESAALTGTCNTAEMTDDSCTRVSEQTTEREPATHSPTPATHSPAPAAHAPAAHPPPHGETCSAREEAAAHVQGHTGQPTAFRGEHTLDIAGDGCSIASSTDSCSSWIELKFQLEGDAQRFAQFVQLSLVFVGMYTLSAATSFFSSLYPVVVMSAGGPSSGPQVSERHSPVDAFMLTSSILVIDITSAFFVVVGFFCAYTLANIHATDVRVLFRIIILYTAIDVWLATLLSVLFGSIFHLLRNTFAPHDIFLTLLEGFTCMRAFELSQSPQSMHSLNPTAWPVLCLLYAFLLAPCTMLSNDRLRRCHPRAGIVLLVANATLPILIISLFGLVQEDTNIFFINSTHFGYRMLEFNLGVCFFTSIQCYPQASTKFTHAIKYAHPLVIVIFLLVWWGQLGSPVQASYGTCIRMYNFSPCIQVHHGFLMRGCLLGITILSKIVLFDNKTGHTGMFDVLSHATSMQTHGASLACCVSSVVLIWPACYIVHLLLEINFSLTLVRNNASLLVIAVPVLTWAVSFLWNNTWKLYVVTSLDTGIDRLWNCLTRMCCCQKQQRE
jgi:hypothetical protein